MWRGIQANRLRCGQFQSNWDEGLGELGRVGSRVAGLGGPRGNGAGKFRRVGVGWTQGTWGGRFRGVGVDKYNASRVAGMGGSRGAGGWNQGLGRKGWGA